jgi:hypothetical protein
VIRAEEAPVVGGQAGTVKAERHHRIIVRGKGGEVNHQLTDDTISGSGSLASGGFWRSGLSSLPG